MNRQVLRSWFLLSIVVPVVASREKKRNLLPAGVPIFFVKRFQRSYYSGRPGLLLHGPEGPLLPLYEQEVQLFIPSRYQYSMYCCCCAFLQLNDIVPEIISTNQIPRQA